MTVIMKWVLIPTWDVFRTTAKPSDRPGQKIFFKNLLTKLLKGAIIKPSKRDDKSSWLK